MLAKTLSIALVGAEAHLVEVEVHSTQGVPNFTVVGLPAKSVREAEQRTRSALLSSGCRWPPSRTLANLAPAVLRKEGTHFDLPIAVGILAADGHLDAAAVDGWVFVGELGLDGTVRPIRGTLAAAIVAAGPSLRGIVCPAANAGEAALVGGVEIAPVATLRECIRFLRGECPPRPVEPAPPARVHEPPDMSDVRGQTVAREALEVAAAGGHNVLMRGAPGCGKTMLARRLPGILPRMSPEEALEVTRVHSIAGVLGDRMALVEQRPFRAPHHGVSTAGLIGGGAGLARPGEVVLANHGVLFMDEMPLFRRDVLESLRAPLEDGVVRIVRGGGAVTFPCRFSLVAAMNPCPCGYAEDPARSCSCSEQVLRGYRNRVSGPLLDRFDMQVEMSRVTGDDLLRAPDGEASKTIRARVESVRDVQRARYGSSSATNASVSKGDLRRCGAFHPSVFRALRTHVDNGTLTGRGLDRVLRLARTLADLEGSAEAGARHASAALALRVETETARRAA